VADLELQQTVKCCKACKARFSMDLLHMGDRHAGSLAGQIYPQT
jgi:hypothetical protein